MRELPLGWREEPLGEVAEVRVSNVDKKSRPFEIPVRLCNYLDAYRGEYLDDSHPYMVATATPAEVTRFGLRAGDVVVTKDSETPYDIGVAATIEAAPDNLVCGYHLAMVRPTAQLNSVWLAKQFATIRVQGYLAARATGTTRYGLSNATLGYLPILVPIREEQDRIIDFLRTLDETIRLTEQLIAKLHQINQGLLHDLLARGIDKNCELRDAVRHPEQFHESPLGLSPKSWDVQRVGDICHLGRGHVISQEYLVAHAGPYPVYSSQSREAGVFGWIDTYDFEGPHVTWTTDGAYAGTVFFRDGRFNCTNVCGTLSRRTDRLDLEYLALALKPRTQRHVSYVGNPKLMNNIMATIPVPLPPTLEQTAIAEIARVASDHVADEIRSAVKLRRIRNGLMEDLLSGHVRVTALLDGDVA